MDHNIVRFPRNDGARQATADTPDDAFDESRFMPRTEVREDYFESVARGYERMRSSRVVVAGLARDIGKVLPKTIARVERLGSMFRDYRSVVYENDSVDDTRSVLHQWSDANPRVSVMCENRADPVNPPTRCLSRAARMAYYRGQCHQVIAREHARFDQVIIVDMDLDGGWSYDGIAHTFGQDDWDFVGANGIIYRRHKLNPNAMLHYDAWAFRVDAEFTPLPAEQVNLMLYDRGQPMVPVYSCFGGLGIYQMPAYLAGRYDGSDIEHVTFHREMHRRGFSRTFFNPSLLTVYGRRAHRRDRLVQKMLRALDILPNRERTVWHFGPSTKEEATNGNSLTEKRAA